MSITFKAMPREKITSTVTLQELYSALQPGGQPLPQGTKQNTGFFVKTEELIFPFNTTEDYQTFGKQEMDWWGDFEMSPIQPGDGLSEEVTPEGIDTEGIAYASEWRETDHSTGEEGSRYREKVYF